MFQREFDFEYVCGFLFNEAGASLRSVVLMDKLRPSWQKGRLNGVGGSIEEHDVSPEAAMRREFYEECGLDIEKWTRYAVLTGRGNPSHIFGDQWRVHFFFAVSEHINDIRKMTDEEPVIAHVSLLSGRCLSNLHYLIPMALSISGDHADVLHIQESYVYQDMNIIDSVTASTFKHIHYREND
jgi:8-oxo-dGTP diphosphatase